MSELLFFIAGLLIGGFAGAAVICMLVVGRSGAIDSSLSTEEISK